MERTLLILVEPNGEVKISYGDPEIMKEIEEDHLSEKESKAFSIPIDGPETSIKAFDVAWEIGDHILGGHNDGPDGLQSVLLKAIKLGAEQSIHIASPVLTEH